MNTRIHLTNAFKVITLLSLNTHNAFAGGTEKSRYSSNPPASHNHGAHDHSSHHSSAHTSTHSGADAPIGVMGDHMHGAGEWMFSLRQIKMEMSGNKIGSNNASDTEILSIANTNAIMPPNLRVVPQHMEMDMTMTMVMSFRDWSDYTGEVGFCKLFFLKADDAFFRDEAWKQL